MWTFISVYIFLQNGAKGFDNRPTPTDGGDTARDLEDEFFDGVAGGDDVEEGVGVRLVAGARVP